MCMCSRSKLIQSYRTLALMLKLTGANWLNLVTAVNLAAAPHAGGM